METHSRAAVRPLAPELPGSHGEHSLQQHLGTSKRARAFYDNQVLDHINADMREYLDRQEMLFISTADAFGNCDCSFRAGPAGFVTVVDERTLAYPEYRGNGVMASLGNLTENPHVGLLFFDFFHTTVGLHVNGLASLLASLEVPVDLRAHDPDAPVPERWVVVQVEEAYIHCSKHVPRLTRVPKDIDWGTDSAARKGGDYFKAKASPAPWKSERVALECRPSTAVSPRETSNDRQTVGDRIRSLAKLLAVL